MKVMGSKSVVFIALGLTCFGSVSQGIAQGQVTFIEVALDEETRRADDKLRRYLGREAGLMFVPERPLEYSVAIDWLANWDSDRGDFLARVTPYAFVAAEMLGADLEVFATYLSKATGSTTYHSYFVVGREQFPYRPELANLVEYLRSLDDPANFIYHNKFSTSSYFLPALFFRSYGIYNMPEPTEYHTAIHSQKLGDSSSNLVRAVALGEFELAAVWDGTKTKFEVTDSLYERYGSRVHFIQLPTILPNDLLVGSATMDSASRARIREAIGSMGPEEIDEGDFVTWLDINRAPDSRQALADLRWLARERPAPVTVGVRTELDEGSRVPDEYLEAARQAVRLSGTEFVNYDDDFHQHQDYVWTLELIHDGAVELTSQIAGSGIDDQKYQISFKDTEDLTRRVGAILHSRMHRIRYVWPYRAELPTVIRDVGFSIPLDATVKVRRIDWQDAQRNLFLQDNEFDAQIGLSDFFRFELYPNFIPADDGGFGFNPMSNVSYRVILVRPEEERPVFRVLTVVFIALLVLTAIAAFADVVKKRALPSHSDRGWTLPTGPDGSISQG
jgi:ABC-type phosphate/phosphonate transport system substrate-binding protein